MTAFLVCNVVNVYKSLTCLILTWLNTLNRHKKLTYTRFWKMHRERFLKFTENHFQSFMVTLWSFIVLCLQVTIAVHYSVYRWCRFVIWHCQRRSLQSLSLANVFRQSTCYQDARTDPLCLYIPSTRTSRFVSDLLLLVCYFVQDTEGKMIDRMFWLIW